jgi:Zn-dependent peptidase ImmA (M78 family)/transcriptional regulator with XRE-family HTH domain
MTSTGSGEAAATQPPVAVRLRAARQARGLTQQQASAALGVSRPLLVSIEKGSRDVQPDELVRLAEIYGRPVSELLRPAAPPIGMGAQFRTALGRSAEADELSQLVGRLEGLADGYVDLVQRADASLPDRYPAERDIRHLTPDLAADDLGSEERNRLGLGDGPIADLRETLENDVGLRIFVIPLPSAVAGLFVMVDVLGACVALNSRHPAERRAWTLAHEYAHFLVARNQVEVTPIRQPPRASDVERFADAFTAAFLMPRSGLTRRFHELKRGRGGKLTPAVLVQLAHVYRVSVHAVTLRLQDLRLIPAATWDRLSAHNFRPRAIAQELGIGRETDDAHELPLHYRLLAAQLYSEGEISEGQLADYLHTDRVGARRAYESLTATHDVAADGSTQLIELAEPSG